MLAKTIEYNIYSFIYLIVKHPLCLECYTRHGGFSGYNNRRDPLWVSGHEICTLDPVLSNTFQPAFTCIIGLDYSSWPTDF